MKLSELILKFGGEEVEAPAKDGETRFDYRGYKVTFEKVDEGFIINYDPPLPSKELDMRYNKCESLKQGKGIAKKAIEVAHEMQVRSSGQAAQAGEVGTPWNSAAEQGKM